MKYLLSLGLGLFFFACGSAQSGSNHYKSNVEGLFTHGSLVSGNTAKNHPINIWTEGYIQTSNNYSNQLFTGFTSDTSGGNVSTYRIDPNSNVLVFPNPFNDVLNLKFSETETLKSMHLFSTDGKLVLSNTQEQSKTASFSTTDLIPGIYILKIKLGNKTFIRRVMKH